MGVDQKFISVISVYAGSVVVIYDLQGDDNLSKDQLL
jgi:hypothetical protein